VIASRIRLQIVVEELHQRAVGTAARAFFAKCNLDRLAAADATRGEAVAAGRRERHHAYLKVA